MADRTLKDLIAPELSSAASPQPETLDLGRVKRNVGKMLDGGASDDEIDAYLGDEGTTPDALRAHKSAPARGMIGDVIHQGLQGVNRGIDATINLPGTIFNLVPKAINYGASKLGYEPPLPDEVFHPAKVATHFNDDEEPSTMAGRVAGSVGEVVGGTIMPSAGIIGGAARMMTPATIAAGRGLLAKAAQAPVATFRNDLISGAGAGLGIGAARENDVGPLGELAAGLAGGIAAPYAVNGAMGAAGTVRDAGNYASRQVERAINPGPASIHDVVDAMVASKTMPGQVLDVLVPPPSAKLQARGFDRSDVADMIARSDAGETNRAIAAHHGVGERTVSAYLDKYSTRSPLQRNIIDVVKDLRGEGGAKPVTDVGRTAMAIGDDAEAAKRLTDRQYQQPGRMADNIQKTAIGGRNFDEEATRLAGVGKQEEDQAYGVVRRNAQPVDLRPVIGTMRRRSIDRGGEVAEQMNKAADLFFEPELASAQRSPATQLRLTEMQERIADAVAKNASPDTIARLQRRLDVAYKQDDFARAARQRNVGRPITDINKFLDQRRELDQMIAKSKTTLGKDTPLTGELNAFRTRINNAARANNPDLKSADLTFSENRTSEQLLADGASLGKKLNQRSRQSIRDFRKMTPTQQETFRVGFERQMADDALGTPRGNAAARQFNNEGFDEIIAELYPKSAGKDVLKRGTALQDYLRGEAISTDTINDVMRGSRTAPVQNSIAEQKELAQAAADSITGRVMKTVENLTNRLARQIGKKAADERLRILTTTQPAELFPLLVKLEKSAGSAAERQAYVVALREFRRARLSPAQIAETVRESGDRGNRNPPLEITIHPRQ